MAASAKQQVDIYAETDVPMVKMPMNPGPSMQVFDDQEFYRRVRRDGRILFTSATAIGLGVVIALAGGYFFWKQNPNQFSSIPQVFVELRALDSDGHPVAAAEVAINGQKVGYTDSFGEWRRFMSYPLGSSLSLQIQKERADETLTATKNLVVPLRRPSSGDVEVKETIQFQAEPVQKIAVAAVPTAKVAVAAPVAEPIAESKISTAGVERFAFNRLAVVIDQGAVPNRATNELGYQRQHYLQTKVVPLVKQSLISGGVAIDDESPWRLTIRHMSAGRGESVIRFNVDFVNAGSEQHASFLRNYLNDPKLMAQQIIGLLRSHTKRSYQILRDNNQWFVMQPTAGLGFWRLQTNDSVTDSENHVYQLQPTTPFAGMARALIKSTGNPCSGEMAANGQCLADLVSYPQSAPKPGWIKQRLVTTTQLPADAKLYVLGYAAARAKDREFDYWSDGQGTPNATVIANDRVIFRGKVLTTADNTHTLAPAAQTVASR